MEKEHSKINYALNILYKHQAVLRANLIINPSIKFEMNLVSTYKKHLREVETAIEFLENAPLK